MRHRVDYTTIVAYSLHHTGIGQAMSLTYIQGDLFTNIANLPQKIMIAHVCNSVGGWGAGFTRSLSKHFPGVEQSYRQLFSDKQYRHEERELGSVQFVVDSTKRVVANMIAQHAIGPGGRLIRYNDLAKCMDNVADFVMKHEIHCPLFGTDLAGGDWTVIEPLIHDCWVSKGSNVVVHYLPGKLPASVKLKS